MFNISKKQYFSIWVLLLVCLIIDTILNPSKINEFSRIVVFFSNILMILFSGSNAYMDIIIPDFKQRFYFMNFIFRPVYLVVLSSVIFMNFYAYVYRFQ